MGATDQSTSGRKTAHCSYQHCKINDFLGSSSSSLCLWAEFNTLCCLDLALCCWSQLIFGETAPPRSLSHNSDSVSIPAEDKDGLIPSDTAEQLYVGLFLTFKSTLFLFHTHSWKRNSILVNDSH